MKKTAICHRVIEHQILMAHALMLSFALEMPPASTNNDK